MENRIKYVLFLLFICNPLLAQWSTDPTQNTVINADPGAQRKPHIVSDGAGGAVVIWEETVSFDNVDIYAQRVDRRGNLMWNAGGVPICTAANPQPIYNVVSDGAGGAIIFWIDFRDAEFGGEPPTWLNNAIYAQRVDSLGSTQWVENGIEIRPILGLGVFTIEAAAVSDDSGGAIFAWGDMRDGGRNIFAQRVTGTGDLLWGEDGIKVNGSWNLRNGTPYMVKDGVGGAIIKYFPDLNLTISRLQRANGDGNLLWVEEGVNSILGSIISDDSGGVIVGWARQLQRYGSDGQKLWGDDGIILNDSVDVNFSIIAPDGNGGVFLMWRDNRTELYEFYSQRLDSSGNFSWQEGGVLYGGGVMEQDLLGGVIYIFSNDETPDADFFVQRLDSTGIPLWGEDAKLFRLGSLGGPAGFKVISDGNSGVIIVWEQQTPSTLSWDVFGQQVSRNGNLGEIITSVEGNDFANLIRGFQVYPPYPNPFNARTIIEYLLPQKGNVRVRIFNLAGKEVWASREGVKKPGKYSFRWDGMDRIGHPVSSGIYVLQIEVDNQVLNRKVTLVK